MIFLCTLVPILLLATAILSFGARQSLLRDMERILREMDFNEVEQRVAWTARHAQLFALDIAGLMLVYLLDFGSSEFRLGWVAVVYIHALSLYLYYVRWNPETLERKRKIDTDYNTDSALRLATFDETANYAISDEGELIKLDAVSDAAHTGRTPRPIDSL